MAGYLQFLAGTLDSLNRVFRLQRELLDISSQLRMCQGTISLTKRIEGGLQAAAQQGFSQDLLNANSVFEGKSKGKSTDSTEYQDAFREYQSNQLKISQASQLSNQQFELINSFTLDMLTEQERDLADRKEEVQAELTEAQQEYKNDKDALKESAKDTAPTFGL